jgi:hypothetical protein
MQTTHAHDKRLVERKYLSNTCTERQKMCEWRRWQESDRKEFALLKYAAE